MSRTKTRLFLTGVSAVAVATALPAVDLPLNDLSFISPAYASGEGEGGEGGEGGAAISHEDAVDFALGMRALEAELNAGWAAAQADDMAGATAHFEAVLAYMKSDKGAALEEDGLDVDHMGDEIQGLIMVTKEATSPDDVRDLYEHGLFEVDEHLLGVDPLLRRDPSFVKAVILGELAEASANFRAAVRDGGDAASARRALAYARIARVEFGFAASGFTEADAGRAAAVIAALDSMVALAKGGELQAFLSASSRAELALSGF